MHWKETYVVVATYVYELKINTSYLMRKVATEIAKN